MLETIKSALFFLWIVLVPFQDSTLQRTQLGFAGASLSVIPLAALAVVVTLEVLSVRRLPRRVMRRAALAIGYAALITTVYVLEYEARYSENFLILKAIKYGVLLVLVFMPVVMVASAREGVVRMATFSAFWISLSGVVFGDVFKARFIHDYFHFTANLNLRPRGLAVESTVLGVQIVTLGLLSVYMARSPLVRTVYFGATVLVVVYSGSKGAAAGIILALTGVSLLAPLSRSGRTLDWRRLGRILVPLGIAAAISGTLAASFYRSTFQYGSVTTRVTTVVAAIEAVVHNPLGMGLGGLTPALNLYLPAAMALVQRLHLLVNFSEVAGYVNNRNGIDISTKSFLFDQFIVFGVPFLLIFWRFHRKIFKALFAKPECYWLTAALAFSLIALVFYYPGLGYYNVPLVYGVAVAASRRVEDSRRSA